MRPCTSTRSSSGDPDERDADNELEFDITEAALDITERVEFDRILKGDGDVGPEPEVDEDVRDLDDGLIVSEDAFLALFFARILPNPPLPDDGTRRFSFAVGLVVRWKSPCAKEVIDDIHPDGVTVAIPPIDGVNSREPGIVKEKSSR